MFEGGGQAALTYAHKRYGRCRSIGAMVPSIRYHSCAARLLSCSKRHLCSNTLSFTAPVSSGWCWACFRTSHHYLEERFVDEHASARHPEGRGARDRRSTNSLHEFECMPHEPAASGDELLFSWCKTMVSFLRERKRATTPSKHGSCVCALMMRSLEACQMHENIAWAQPPQKGPSSVCCC